MIQILELQVLNIYGNVVTAVSSRCWDAMIRWLNKTNPDGAYNTKGQQGSIINTGTNDEYKVNNIYDIAGNVSECVVNEFYGKDMECVYRGADSRTIPLSASMRGHTTDIKGSRMGTRQVLFINVEQEEASLSQRHELNIIH